MSVLAVPSSVFRVVQETWNQEEPWFVRVGSPVQTDLLFTSAISSTILLKLIDQSLRKYVQNIIWAISLSSG